MSKIQSTVTVLAFSFVVTSCQAKTVDAQTNTLMKKVVEIVKNTPPLHKVSWKVCGVEKILSMNRSLKNQCLEESQVVWGPATQHQIVRTREFTTGIDVHIFAKSRGCLIMGNPTTEDYYLMKTYRVGPANQEATLPKPTANVKIEQLSTKEKTDTIYKFVSAGSEPFLLGIRSQYDCQSKPNWDRN
ncbi:hypothetical protein FNW02_33010 [Komarekiella sp. 'clone 1']|uniref:Uncharacterized protein n=1 Tax=Komarekiella delphini-convector SJRDD-AB1 TaxID=2593771 RepID=A0AA40T4E7_9NOST|nr:hypothetical protein [Komarekiella delphini-convector SJRDD-AB1]